MIKHVLMLKRLFTVGNGIFFKAIIFILLIAIGSFFEEHAYPRRSPQPPEISDTRLKILNCYDGDTCQAKTKDGIRLTLRLIGIDAPEISRKGKRGKNKEGQTYAQESRDYLRKHTEGKNIPVRIMGSDTYKRYLALLYPERLTKPSDDIKKSLNYEMVIKGYAFAYKDKRSDKKLLKEFMGAENSAAQKRIGFWGLQKPPEDPAKFRRN